MKLKKAIMLLPALAALGVTALTGCNKNKDVEFTIWTFSTEMSKIVKRYYSSHNVKVVNKGNVDAVRTDFEAYLQANKQVPDIICLEAAVVAEYRESNIADSPLMALEDITTTDDMYSYTKDVVRTPDNHLVGLSWQATPGGFFYREDTAKKIGITTVEQMDTYMTSWTKFLELADLCRSHDIAVTSGITDAVKVFLSQRENPWVVNNQLQMETVLFGNSETPTNCFDFVRKMHHGNYTHQTALESSGYYSDMESNNTLGYFCSSWGLFNDIMTHTSESAGHWRMSSAPINFFKGGTWLSIPKKAEKADAAKEFIKYITSDKDFLRNRCKETGDFMNSMSIMSELKDQSISSFEFGSFLGGQTNYLSKLYESAQHINGALISKYDSVIDGSFSTAVADYAKAGYQAGQTEDPYTPEQRETLRTAQKGNFVKNVKKTYPSLVNPTM